MLAGVLLSCLLLLSISCTKTDTITKTEYVYLTPPGSLLQVREDSGDVPETNMELLEAYLDQQEIIELHNQDKQSLQLWKQGVPDE